MKLFFYRINQILDIKQKRKILLLIVFMILGAMLEVCGVSSVFPVLAALMNKDIISRNVFVGKVCAMLGITSYREFLLFSIFSLILIFIVKNIFFLFRRYYHAKFALELQCSLRHRVFAMYLQKPYQFFLDVNSSEINKIVTDDVTKTYQIYNNLIIILAESILTIFLIITAFIIDWKISLGLAIGLSVIFGIILFVIKPISRQSGIIANDAIRERNRWLYQAITGIKTIKITENAPYFSDKSKNAELSFAVAEQKHIVLSSVPRSLVEMIGITIFLSILAIMVLNGEDFASYVPKIGAIAMAALKLLPSFNKILESITNIHYRIPSLEKISVAYSENREKAEPNFNKQVLCYEYKDCIGFNNVSYRYPETERDVLKDVSLTIPIGKMVGIIGTSGEGKTTFIDVMLGLLVPQKGQVTIDGLDINSNLQQWHKSVGYIAQDMFLLDDTVRNNVAFGVEEKDIDDKQIWKALEKAQIADFIRSLQDGLSTSIGERGVKLSGGQRQRIGIARVLFENPQILVFDEATSALDSETESAVADAIDELYGEKTIIVIAHRSCVLDKCDILYKMQDGKLRECYPEKAKVN